jgi:hypothetical protein
MILKYLYNSACADPDPSLLLLLLANNKLFLGLLQKVMTGLLEALSRATVYVSVISRALSNEHVRYSGLDRSLSVLRQNLHILCMRLRQQCPTQVNSSVTCDEQDAYRAPPNRRFLTLAFAQRKNDDADDVRASRVGVMMRTGFLTLANIERFLFGKSLKKAMLVLTRYVGRIECSKWLGWRKL